MVSYYYGFADKLKKSKETARFQLEQLSTNFPNCKIEIGTKAEDLMGIDYKITQPGGHIINVDGKIREEGCSRFWSTGPELALEIWSILPGGKFNTPQHDAKVGWTLDDAKQTDLVLHSYHPNDTSEYFLLKFLTYKETFRYNITKWKKQYKHPIQTSDSWQSQCIFIPAKTVVEAIRTFETSGAKSLW